VAVLVDLQVEVTKINLVFIYYKDFRKDPRDTGIVTENMSRGYFKNTFIKLLN